MQLLVPEDEGTMLLCVLESITEWADKSLFERERSPTHNNHRAKAPMTKDLVRTVPRYCTGRSSVLYPWYDTYRYSTCCVHTRCVPTLYTYCCKRLDKAKSKSKKIIWKETTLLSDLAIAHWFPICNSHVLPLLSFYDHLGHVLFPSFLEVRLPVLRRESGFGILTGPPFSFFFSLSFFPSSCAVSPPIFTNRDLG